MVKGANDNEHPETVLLISAKARRIIPLSTSAFGVAQSPGSSSTTCTRGPW